MPTHAIALAFFLVGSIPAVHLQPCAIDDVGGAARCGAIEVFENHDTRSGRRIALNVIVLDATGPRREPDPLLVLQGGPGQGAAGLADFYARLFAPVRERRDIVLVDVRGTGRSNPLNCDVLAPPFGAAPDFIPSLAVAACRVQLEKKADLRLYTTGTIVRDLEEVRQALGYERVNLYGTSYGTRLALEYIRRHPDRVRSAALKAVVPPGLAMPVDHARNAQRVLDIALERCAADAACRTTQPNPRQELDTVLERLKRKPVTVAVKRRGGSVASIRLDRGAFAEAFRSVLYSPQSALQAPAIIRRALEGDYERVADMALRTKVAFNRDLSLGMFLSVTCAEDIPKIDPARILDAVRGTFLGDYRIRQQMQACERWPQGAVPPDFNTPVRSSTPVLLLSGDLDPVTPPAYGEEIVATLPNGRHIVIRNNGHAVGTAGPCIGKMTAQLVGGTPPRQIDASCAAQ